MFLLNTLKITQFMYYYFDEIQKNATFLK